MKQFVVGHVTIFLYRLLVDMPLYELRLPLAMKKISFFHHLSRFSSGRAVPSITTRWMDDQLFIL